MPSTVVVHVLEENTNLIKGRIMLASTEHVKYDRMDHPCKETLNPYDSTCQVIFKYSYSILFNCQKFSY